MPRVKKFFANYAAVEDNRYAEVVSTYLWTALPQRILEPGSQVDQMIILVGTEEGESKSRFIEAIAPKREWCASIDFGEDPANLSRRMVGSIVLLGEEIRGLASAEGDHIKTVLTTRVESWIPKYKEDAIFYPRRGVMIGATNDEHFLTPRAGKRRWLPVRVGGLKYYEFLRDRDQLWAEGLAMTMTDGLPWKEAEALGRIEHEDYRVTDTWEEAIETWWARKVGDAVQAGVRPDEVYFSLSEVMEDALNMRVKDDQARHAMRLGNALRRVGFKSKPIGAARRRRWYMPLTLRG